MASRSSKSRVSRARRPARKAAARTPAAGARKPSDAAFAATLSRAQLAWIDSTVDAIAGAGGPRFTREDVVSALFDAAAGRPIDARKVKTPEDLRIALGALDLSTVERMLRERPRIEGGLLKALEDSIK